MANYKCQKCGNIWNGWAKPDICPDCSGELEKIENDKKKQR